MDVTKTREQKPGRRQTRNERRSFTHTADRTHVANVPRRPKRGGGRL